MLFRNNKAVDPSNTLWSHVRLNTPVFLIAIESVPSADSTTTGFFLIDSVERIATFGWLMIGEVMKELNDPLLDIVNVLPVTSSRPYFLFLRSVETSVIFLASPRKLKESESFTVPTSNPSLFKSTAMPKLIKSCSSWTFFPRSNELFTTGNSLKALMVATEINGKNVKENPSFCLNSAFILFLKIAIFS